MKFRWILATVVLFFSLSVSVVLAQGNLALSLDGSDDYVNCGSGESLDTGSGHFTFESWFKTTDDSTINYLMDSRSGSYSGFYVLWDGRIGEKDIDYGVTDASNSYHGSYATSVNNGTWHHVAMVRDGNRPCVAMEQKIQLRI